MLKHIADNNTNQTQTIRLPAGLELPCWCIMPGGITAAASPCVCRCAQTLTTPSRRLRSPPASGSGTAREPPTRSCSAPDDRIRVCRTCFYSREGRRPAGKRGETETEREGERARGRGRGRKREKLKKRGGPMLLQRARTSPVSFSKM